MSLVLIVNIVVLILVLIIVKERIPVVVVPTVSIVIILIAGLMWALLILVVMGTKLVFVRNKNTEIIPAPAHLVIIRSPIQRLIKTTVPNVVLQDLVQVEAAGLIVLVLI